MTSLSVAAVQLNGVYTSLEDACKRGSKGNLVENNHGYYCFVQIRHNFLADTLGIRELFVNKTNYSSFTFILLLTKRKHARYLSSK